MQIYFTFDGLFIEHLETTTTHIHRQFFFLFKTQISNNLNYVMLKIVND